MLIKVNLFFRFHITNKKQKVWYFLSMGPKDHPVYPSLNLGSANLGILCLCQNLLQELTCCRSCPVVRLALSFATGVLASTFNLASSVFTIRLDCGWTCHFHGCKKLLFSCEMKENAYSWSSGIWKQVCGIWVVVFVFWRFAHRDFPIAFWWLHRTVLYKADGKSISVLPPSNCLPSLWCQASVPP